MYCKNICIAIFSLALFICSSCQKEDEPNTPIRLSIEHVFEPFITGMDSSSPISLPGNVYTEIAIINSHQELIDKIPSDIIEGNSLYENIDYDSNSLLSVKFRCFYKPDKIEYKIYRNDDDQISIGQLIYVSEPLNVNGYFVLSNLVTEKLNANDQISFTQSFEEE